MAFKFALALVALSTAVLSETPHPQHPPQPRYRPDPYQPPSSYHVPERNCSVEYEKAEAELCVPTLQTTCTSEEVTLKTPSDQERCITIPMVTCKAEVSTETIEICVYVYEKKEIETDAKVADVKYTKRCDTDYVSVCKTQKHVYGYDKPKEVCKEVPQETCFNKPLAESKTTQVTVTIPQPVKKCETKRIKIPSVTCEEETEERCFNLVKLEDKTQTIEKCTTSLAAPKCNKVSLHLPAQTCVEELKTYKNHYQN